MSWRVVICWRVRAVWCYATKPAEPDSVSICCCHTWLHMEPNQKLGRITKTACNPTFCRRRLSACSIEVFVSLPTNKYCYAYNVYT